MFRAFDHLNFGFVSDFDFRISSLSKVLFFRTGELIQISNFETCLI